MGVIIAIIIEDLTNFNLVHSALQKFTREGGINQGACAAIAILIIPLIYMTRLWWSSSNVIQDKISNTKCRVFPLHSKRFKY